MLEPHQRAQSLVGVPFRFQGRDPALGLDCLGVIVCAFDLEIEGVPRYRITEGDWELIERELSVWFSRADERLPASNDVLVFRLPRSFHFGVVSGNHFVHADLGLGRVALRRLPERLGRDCRLFSFNGD